MQLRRATALEGSRHAWFRSVDDEAPSAPAAPASTAAPASAPASAPAPPTACAEAAAPANVVVEHAGGGPDAPLDGMESLTLSSPDAAAAPGVTSAAPLDPANL